jgi:hypothetical protein
MRSLFLAKNGSLYRLTSWGPPLQVLNWPHLTKVVVEVQSRHGEGNILMGHCSHFQGSMTHSAVQRQP